MIEGIAVGALCLMGMGLMAFIVLRELQQNKLIRDLTAKIMARDVMDYRIIQEDQPQRAEKDKKKKLTDPTLGTDY